MIRLFTAIEIPPAVAARLRGLQSGLAGAHWINPDELHLTVRFIGAVPEPVADGIDSVLAQVRAQAPQVRLAGAGVFATGRRGRVVWAGVAAQAALHRLRGLVCGALAREGVAPEARRWTPHVTLARVRTSESSARVWAHSHDLFRAPAFTPRRFVLFSSRGVRGGGPYVVERGYRLGAPDWPESHPRPVQ